MSDSAKQPVHEHVKYALRTLHEPGQVFEIRILEHRQANGYATNLGGYFDDFDAAARIAADYSGSALGVYTTLNTLDPSLLARCANRVRQLRKGEATGDKNIVRLRWLLVDLDAQRASGISASESEKTAAIQQRDKTRIWLKAQGFPDPVVADSGNGGHLLYRVDLSPDDEIVREVLRALSRMVSDGSVVLDHSVGKAAQITKAYGTLTCKGDSTPERPHRYSWLGRLPPSVEIVPRELLEELIRDLPPLVPRSSASVPRGPGTGAFDLAEWIARFLPGAGDPSPWNGGTRWTIQICPFNNDHNRGEAFVAQLASGAISAGCHHQSCLWKWSDLRAKFDRTPKSSKGGAAGIRGHLVTASDLKATSVEWIWPGYLPRGKLALLEGDPDVGKSTISIDIAARISKGAPMPFEANHGSAADVILLASEDGVQDTILPRLRAAGADLSRVHVFSVQEDGVNNLATFPQHVPLLEDKVVETNAILVIVDPLVEYFLVDTYTDAKVRRALAPLVDMMSRQKLAVLGIRHLTKAAGGRALYRGGGSIAFVATARSALLAGRDPASPDLRVLASTKSNLSKRAPSLRYKLVAHGESHKVEWVGVAPDVSADDLVRPTAGEARNTATDEAADWLRGVLGAGETRGVDVANAAAREGINKRVLRRARETLGVVVRRTGSGQDHTAYWSLASTTTQTTPALRPLQYGGAGVGPLVGSRTANQTNPLDSSTLAYSGPTSGLPGQGAGVRLHPAPTADGALHPLPFLPPLPDDPSDPDYVPPTGDSMERAMYRFRKDVQQEKMEAEKQASNQTSDRGLKK